jgi:type II secretory pathway pseudopilin PulG
MRTHKRMLGFAYLGLVVAVAVMGVALAATGGAWQAAARRDKERELLFAGDQIRQALAQYYLHAPPQAPRHPQGLDDLLRDPRVPGTWRYLRKIYPDPMTGKPEWGLVRGADGAIYGVHSLSRERPLKRARFSRLDQNFAQAATYADWVFMFSPSELSGGTKQP